MPPYELVLIYRAAPKPELKEIIKRTISMVKNHNGAVAGMEQIGDRALPYVMKSHGVKYDKGFYMFMKADVPATKILDLKSNLRQDRDIIRPSVLRQEVEMPRPCKVGPCFFGDINNSEHALAVKWGTFKKLDV